MPPTAPVVLDLRRARTSSTFALGGAVDREGTPSLRAMLDAHCAATDGDVVVDCKHLLLVDSAGADMLFDVGRSLDAEGRALRIARVPNGACRRLFATHGLHSVMISELDESASETSTRPRRTCHLDDPAT